MCEVSQFGAKSLWKFAFALSFPKMSYQNLLVSKQMNGHKV
ncbi:hypothetical protein ASZ86_03130 [Vibrio cholerae]|nr:hypothetical protein ASZ86_03130 [Vibrio cholerae]